MASWDFYTADGFLKVGLVTTSLGDADTLDGKDSTEFILKAGDSGIGTLSLSGAGSQVVLPNDPTTGNHAARQSYTEARYLLKESGESDSILSDITVDAASGGSLLRNSTGDSPAAGEYVWREHVDATFLPLVGGTLTGDLIVSGSSLYLPNTTISGNTTLDETNRTIFVDTTAGPITVTLPSPHTVGQFYEIKDVGSAGVGNASANNITIDPNGSNLDGLATDRVVNVDGEALIVASDGTDWFTVATFSSGGSVSELNDLDDVNLAGPTGDEMLRYDAVGGEWVDTSLVTLNATGRFSVTTDSISAGLAIGSDTELIRSGVDTLHTPNRMELAGAVQHRTRPVASNYTVDLLDDYTIFCNPSGGGFTVTLPSGHSAGDTIVVKETAAAASVVGNEITIDTADAALIDGQSDYVISTNYVSVTLQSDGTDWFII